MKRGKREKVKTPTLQSYILSMLSLVLCCAMFMSATMAWFTSEVTTTGNQIYVGALDVDLRDAAGNTLHGKTGVLFDTVLLGSTDADGNIETTSVTCWQDGAMAIEPLQVVNEGDLAFRYDLYLTLSVDSSDEINQANLSAVTNQFEVYVLRVTEAEWPQYTSYIDVTSESDWEKVSVETSETDADGNPNVLYTLSAILETGTPLFSGIVTADEIIKDKSNGVETAHKYIVALRMKDASATVIEVDEEGNEITVSIMGKTLTLNTKLVASQLIEEQSAEDSADGNTSTGEQSVSENNDSTNENPTAEEAGGETTT